MKISAKYEKRLLEIFSGNNLSLRDTLTTCRRLSRHAAQVRDGEREQYRVEIRQAEKGLPFTKAKVDALKDRDRESHDRCEAILLPIGKWLAGSGPEIERAYGFEGICDLLNVNPVHRGGIKADHDGHSNALVSIAHFEGLEDSAEQLSGRKEREWKDGPLFWCYMEVLSDYIAKNPGSFFGAMSKPGGPLHGIPAYRVTQDGMVTIERPSLEVHENNGNTTTVQRKPEVIGRIIK
ncbi:hypothetical protein [Pseudomonas sp. REB1044]|uniref:hypothetical protein n=1 Tax=Pseudomonas sp. REB1044 TaxID=2675224 RepID=UPI00315C7626